MIPENLDNLENLSPSKDLKISEPLNNSNNNSEELNPPISKSEIPKKKKPIIKRAVNSKRGKKIAEVTGMT